MNHFMTSLEHILAELERIDILIRMQVERSRQIGDDNSAYQGLYISEAEVDRLLAKPTGLPDWASVTAPFSQASVQAALSQLAAAIETRKTASQGRGIPLRLEQVMTQFGLTRFEGDALLIGLAPSLDTRYERLYGYLHDNVTQKQASVDLILNVLCSTFQEKAAARQYFSPSARLLKYQLLSPVDDIFLKVDARLLDYLLDADTLDDQIAPYATLILSEKRLDDLILPTKLRGQVTQLINQVGRTLGPVTYLQGPPRAGKQTTAEAICGEIGLGLLVIETRSLLKKDEQTFRRILRRIQREAVLQGAAVYWQGFDNFLTDEQTPQRGLLLAELAAHPVPTFLAGDKTWEPSDELPNIAYMRLEFERPSYGERLLMWERFLAAAPVTADIDPHEVAGKFRLQIGQIQDAVRSAYNAAFWRDPGQTQITPEDLYTACRLHSNQRLAELARKITPHYRWDDIVLPPDRIELLREICNYVHYRAQVYDEWGFDDKLALGKGLNVLFAGPSGTGKTMSADIIAGELGLDLYKIDLSTIISKYIGETEKNLSQIFNEAETSNAILFFDEADALFGKRSEVRDSHDRYANVEISYLLQKMEEYTGVVILATNLRKNMDDAFVRRMHFTVDFPFPSVEDRRRIWEHIWPAQLPRQANLDYDLIARNLELAGGNIRNIALAAAFLAADDSGIVEMNHILRAARREYQKMGKVVTQETFRE
jgi:adenylate kinase family enzyme